MPMKRELSNVARRMLRPLAKAAMKCGLIPREVIIRMDGGVCSQLHFYLMGEIFRRRGCRVSFDTSWFETCGMDLDGRFVRNLDLLKLFPSLPWHERRGGVVLSVYRRLFCHRSEYFSCDSTAWTDMDAPCYFTGYYHDPKELYGKMFYETFSLDTSVLDEVNSSMLDKILAAGEGAVAIHVRRGDLSGYNPAYGNPATTGYFRRAVAKVAELHADPGLFIFSDEPEWCRECLLPSLPGYKITVVDINGSDRGYMDLVLMAHCPNVITSKGSLGKYAAMLRINRDGIVTLCDEPDSTIWLDRIPGSVALSLDDDGETDAL